MLLPDTMKGLTPELLTQIVRQIYPGGEVSSVELVKTHEYGDGNVSTTARTTLDLECSGSVPEDFPRRVMAAVVGCPSSGVRTRPPGLLP
jgi:hypothetical protein